MAAEAGEDRELTAEEKEYVGRMQALQEAERAFLEQSFRWLIEFVASYFPEDQLALEDAVTDVMFLQRVVEKGEALGLLVYRFRKVQDKKAYFGEVAEEYRREMEVPEVLFVDSDSPAFEAPRTVETDEPYLEIPPEKLTGRIRELREELKRKARLRKLRESV